MNPSLDKRSHSSLRKDPRVQPLVRSKRKRVESLLRKPLSKTMGRERWAQSRYVSQTHIVLDTASSLRCSYLILSKICYDIAMECRKRFRLHRTCERRGRVSLISTNGLYHWHTNLTIHRSAFFHKRSFASSDEPYVGQAVSFVFEQGPKGAAAVKVKEEEGAVIGKEEIEEEGEREMGKVKVCSRHLPIHVPFCGSVTLDLG